MLSNEEFLEKQKQVQKFIREKCLGLVYSQYYNQSNGHVRIDARIDTYEQFYIIRNEITAWLGKAPKKQINGHPVDPNSGTMVASYICKDGKFVPVQKPTMWKDLSVFWDGFTFHASKLGEIAI